MKQSEIWIADLCPRMGTEPGKMRPVLIVQTDLLKGTSNNSFWNFKAGIFFSFSFTKNGV